ncbi:MAG TPA: SIR2 family protein, partial [Bacteroidales bacterium]|nr:SIR2 family protein [Bacteroidales bacterium]
MRFIENGPSIPDELLTARDEGRVVLFCGAGVSRARAGLPDFFGLAEIIIDKLGVQEDSTIHAILKEAKEIGKRCGEHGLIAADRIFGLLEREFHISDIERVVAERLKPPGNVDLSAHQILLDLATTSEGKVRLVTTNFDRMFNDCDPKLKIMKPPRLPNPFDPNEFDGITYLHNCVNSDYSGTDGNGFILTSSAFGQAYLSEGWATEFFKQVLEKYVVLFIGYSADDPPIHYLLEAINRRDTQVNRIYAFQEGSADEAIKRWYHKGVIAIHYEDQEHRSLWESLKAWSERAKNPEKWYKSVIDLADKGPGNLKPHERGQVAHIISTIEGSRLISTSNPPIPAEWLCVFDSRRRYAIPGCRDMLSSDKEYIDPFSIYRIDTDIVPEKIEPDDFQAKREIPAA